MKKKLLAGLLALGMVASLAACSNTETTTSTNPSTAPSTESTAPSTGADMSSLDVGVFYYQYSDVYITSVRNQMDAKLDELGVKYTDYDGQNTQPTQLDQINTAITNGCNLLIVNIVETSSPDAAQQAADAAKNAGIPIIFFNREVSDDVVNSYENCAFVGHMQGEMIADYLIENYDAVDLNGDGKISYVMFKGQEGNAEAEYRTQFSVEDANKILAENGHGTAEDPALTFYAPDNTSGYLVDTTGAWSAQAATDYMNTILAEYTEANGNMVEMVIANNDGMAEGAISALQGAGYNQEGGDKIIPVFGVDAIDSAKEKIDKGIMTGTVMQDAEGMADTLIALLTNVGNGEELMANTDSFNVDDSVAKIRVPYGLYQGK